ncbi:xanthine dehydrogenase family protein subunit M [Pseudonocardia eucalypti]|uniref:Xanthine dehydrogenase family protein subunit M n=1 Tax=Pseudonocardia eucalypti TaxID=648755 RepID=A0ABP9RCB5_9PSEU|nr:carbon-monoxide dehydrogenase medium subunit [Pseudonocardia eucalypti]
MKLPGFTYHRPESLDETLSLLAELGDDAKVLAGGQSLLPVLALRMSSVAHLIDIGRVAGLDRIDRNGDGIAVGARVRHAEVEHDPAVAKAAPLVSAAMPLVGHRAIRNRGTTCGSLAHADPSAELPAVALALDARLVVRSRSGERLVPAGEFFQGVFTTDLAETELLTGVRFPPWPAGAGWSVRELSRRHGDFAIAGLAAVLDLDRDGAVESAALSFFGVAGVPRRVAEAEQVLLGERPGAALFEEAGQIVAKALEPPEDLHGSSAYRKHVAGVLTRRCLKEAAERAGAGR